ncbi:ricin-type beta-trefoil lectin domain protein [Kribbella endophytica]
MAGDATTLGRPGPYRIQSNSKWRHCLDSNGSWYDGVYLGTCVDGDAGQKWVIWNGGFIQRYANANQCLQAWGEDIITASCDSTNRDQYWQHWGTTTGGFIKNLGSGLCMVSSATTTLASCAGADHNPGWLWQVRLRG